MSAQRSSKSVPSYLVGGRTPFILLRELGQVSVQCWIRRDAVIVDRQARCWSSGVAGSFARDRKPEFFRRFGFGSKTRAAFSSYSSGRSPRCKRQELRSAKWSTSTRWSYQVRCCSKRHPCKDTCCFQCKWSSFGTRPLHLANRACSSYNKRRDSSSIVTSSIRCSRPGMLLTKFGRLFRPRCRSCCNPMPFQI